MSPNTQGSVRTCRRLIVVALLAGCSTPKAAQPLAAEYKSAVGPRDRTGALLKAVDGGLVADTGLGPGGPTSGTGIQSLEEIVGKFGPDAPGVRLVGAPWEHSTGTKFKWYVVDLIGSNPPQGASPKDLKWYFVSEVYPDGMLGGSIAQLCFGTCLYHLNRQLVWDPGLGQAREYRPDGIVPRELSADESRRVKGLRAEYLVSKSQYERRAIAVTAIHEGLIAEGRPIAIVDELFGTACDKARPSEQVTVCEHTFMLAHHWAVEEQSKLNRKAWLLWVYYDSRGKIVCAMLVDTAVHKT